MAMVVHDLLGTQHWQQDFASNREEGIHNEKGKKKKEIGSSSLL
jgi:hypothetical protein